MELRQLTYFVAVAEELHFGRAAKRVHIAQPPLSQQIKKLEEELGVQLFERTSRQVSLTPEGSAFLEKARIILREVKQAKQTVTNVAQGQTGKLHIGFVGAAVNIGLPTALLHYRTSYPAVTLTLRELGTNKQFRLLTQERLDAGFFTPGRELPTELNSIPFAKEKHILTLPENHPLSKYEKVPLECLKNVPLIMFPRTSNPLLFDQFYQCCDAAGFSPVIAQEASGPVTITALVQAGLGAAFVPQSVKNMPRKGVHYREVDGQLPYSLIHLGWYKNRHNPALENFIACMQQH
jgi:DNA-binding transcriptional LysR family regulator